VRFVPFSREKKEPKKSFMPASGIADRPAFPHGDEKGPPSKDGGLFCAMLTFKIVKKDSRYSDK
jgi:hypothetical protein